ncbi:uncharacterized protein ARMOST_19812 [Armillaria ostoyae]|uniref:Retrotransposon gag domain-containing protein n=1 Tax=Armillaria ostoyae TaxID=47428 RepID=A0A284S5J8_ARMOS|nr:uncharacterized protein ARMOST_19812 [Armillaria ostoyae]
MSGTNSLLSTSSSSAPTTLPPGNYGNETSRPDTSFTQTTGHQWAGTSPWSEAIPFPKSAEMPPSQPAYTTTGIAATMVPPPDTYYKDDQEDEQPENSSSWSSPFSNWPLASETRMPLSSNQFDSFHYNYETFGRLDEVTSRTEREGRQYVPYPFQLPDSPPWQIRQHGQYHGQKTSRLYADANDRAGGSNDIPVNPPADPPTNPPQPSPAERLQLAMEVTEWKARRIEEIWLLPQPPPKWQVDPPQPTGEAGDDALWLGLKPVTIQPPLPFKGKYDDIERFIGDCCMYFEVYAPFFQLHSQKVAFATSYFEGNAKDWWVHKCQEFWTSADWQTAPK